MAKILIKDITETPELFKEVHGKGVFLGSSEIATVAGLNEFQTPLQLWMRKTGRDTSDTSNYHTKLGNLMESVVSELFLDQNKNFKFAKKINTTYQHDAIEWATCTPDFCLSEVDYGVDLWKQGANKLLEIKTSGAYAKKKWEDGNVPDYALCQVQWQLGILGLGSGYIAALIGGKDYFQKEIKFSKDIFDQLVELGARFVNLINSDKAPEANFNDDLSFIKPIEKEVELRDSMEKLKQYELLTEEIKQIEATKKLKEQTRETLKNQLIQQLGDANKGICGPYVITRKIIDMKESIRKAHQQIRFNVKNVKEKENEDN